jgi:hypothetical protein
MVALSILIALSSSDSHRKNEGSGRLGAWAPRWHVGRRRGVGEGAFRVWLGDGGGGDVDNFALQGAEPGTGKASTLITASWSGFTKPTSRLATSASA